MALANSIPVFQPKSLREDMFQQTLCACRPEVIVVAAFGKILPPPVLSVPPLGCLNVHGSLLPRYRGAAPGQRAVMQGEKQTGVTIMKMDEGLDTGDILLKRSMDIFPDETAGELFDRIAKLGGLCICEALKNINHLEPVKQEDAFATWAPPLKSEDGHLNLSESARRLYDRYRGVTPQPGAYCLTKSKRVKIHKAAIGSQQGEIGVLLDPKRLVIGCGDGSLELIEVQPEGSKSMAGSAYMNGRRLKPGVRVFDAQ
jgi:methionyl-tRNA formyltransferase